MGIWRDTFIGKTAKLITDHFQLIIQPRGAKGGVTCVILHQFNQLRAGGGGIGACNQGFDFSAVRHCLAKIL